MSTNSLLSRQKAAARKRRIILNNDGNEPTVQIQAPTETEILKYRTAPLIGSQVDSIFYCTCGGGFGLFTHLSRVGQIFTTTEGRYAPNKVGVLAETGIDPLKVVAAFCHSREIEIFWSFRMNDTHDGSTSDYGAILSSVNKLKKAHPEYLIGSPDDRPRYGSWTAVDYGNPEVRELSYLFVEEIVRNYDIDGIELDFFRHPVFFRRPAYGLACTQTELDIMSVHVARIRRLLDDQAAHKGRPLLLAVRTPDHRDYCRKIGLDIERWFGEGLVDLYIPGGYFQLQPWERSIELGHRYGVKVYPSLDESRVKIVRGSQKEFHGERRSLKAYRAGAMNALDAGADGIYLFNFFDPGNPMLREIGEIETMQELDKTYFHSLRGIGSVAGNGFPHEDFISPPVFDPQHPLPLYPSKKELITVRTSEDHWAQGKKNPSVSIVLEWERTPPRDPSIDVSVNGHPLPHGTPQDSRLVYHPDALILRRGTNTILLNNPGEKIRYLTDVMIEYRYS